MTNNTRPASKGFNEILLYTAPNGKIKVEIYLQNETIWLTQDKIAILFGVERSVVTKHLKNIYEEGELIKEATCAKIAQVKVEGGREVTRNIEFYNLDAIISVGYRVNSTQATHFRIWATALLKDYIIKGFAMDDERLKNPNNIFGKDYFEEQLARIRDIRSSERRFYQKITEIYSQCSADYVLARAGRIKPDRFNVSGLCRKSGKKRCGNVYERLGVKIRCFPTIQRGSGFETSGLSFA